jgi:hypothetical protein
VPSLTILLEACGNAPRKQIIQLRWRKKIAHAAGANLLAAAVRKAARRHAKKSRRESEEGEMISILLLVFFCAPAHLMACC